MSRALVFGELALIRANGDEFPGGPAFNVATHLSKRGVETSFMSAVGADDEGKRLKKAVDECAINHPIIQTTLDSPSSTATARILPDERSEYVYAKRVAWDFIGFPTLVEKALDAPFDLCYFDMLVQRSEATRDALSRVLEKLTAKHIFFDMNIQTEWCSEEAIERSLKKATILKLRRDDIEILRSTICEPFAHENDAALLKRLADDYRIPTICLTLGREGALALQNDTVVELPMKLDPVVDLFGVENAFSAGFALGILNGVTISRTLAQAIRFAEYIATVKGSIPQTYPDEVFA